MENADIKKIVEDFAMEVEDFAQDKLDKGEFADTSEEVALEDLRNRARNMRTEFIDEVLDEALDGKDDLSEKKGETMRYQEILDFLSKNKVNDYKTMVATTCDSAWNGCKDAVSKWLDFDRFCASCDEMWCDCENETGLSRIADYVADYAVEHRKLPSSYDGMVRGLEYDDED